MTITNIRAELQSMVNTLQTTNTYQEALNIWQHENHQLTADEINQVMTPAASNADPFGEYVSDLNHELDPFQ